MFSCVSGSYEREESFRVHIAQQSYSSLKRDLLDLELIAGGQIHCIIAGKEQSHYVLEKLLATFTTVNGVTLYSNIYKPQ